MQRLSASCDSAPEAVLRVSYSCHDAFPSAAVHTQQIFWTLVEVARRGLEVRLNVPMPRTASAAQARERPDKREELARWYGLPPGTLPEGFRLEGHPGIASPVWLSKAAFDLRVPSLLTRQQPDLVWTRNVAAALWSTRAGLPTVFETYRPDLATSSPFRVWRRAVLESPHLRGVIHHSAVAGEAFARAGVPAARRLVARNGFAPAWMMPRLDVGDARERLDLPANRPLVVYAGDVHPAKGIEALVRMAAAVPDALVLLLGARDERAAQRAASSARTLGARNVLVRPRVAVGQVAAYLYAADCLVIPPPAEPLARSRTVLPIKVFMYLAAGRAILAPRRADLEEVLADGVNARLFAPDDLGAAVQGLGELLTDESLRTRIAARALADAPQFTWEARAERITAFLERVSRAGWPS